MTPDPIIDWETDYLRYEQRHRWKDTGATADKFNAALEEWVRRGEEPDHA